MIIVDFLTRMLGKKRQVSREPALPKSHFYPVASLALALVAVSDSFLLLSGWRRSRSERRSVDRKGAALPWLTYPSIAFLEKVDLSGKIVLEFGGGGSTAYFSRRSKRVTTIELDGLYLDSLRKLGLRNVEFFEWSSSASRISQGLLSSLNGLAPKEARYESLEDIRRVIRSASEISQLVKSADVVLIDGGPRAIYSEIVARFAKNSAIIIIDNTDMIHLLGLPDRFSDENYLKIPFVGLGPINPYAWETTVLIPRAHVG